MNLTEIEAGVVQVLRQRLNIQGPLSSETDLVADLQLDSIKLLTLVVELENRFQVCFEQGDEAEVRTLADLSALVARRLGGGAS